MKDIVGDTGKVYMSMNEEKKKKFLIMLCIKIIFQYKYYKNVSFSTIHRKKQSVV